MNVQGFPILGKQLKIINKLNGMALTISQGWHNTKVGFAIIQKPDFPQLQSFRITQKEKSQVYFISNIHKQVCLSTKTWFGDMVYSEVQTAKFNEQTSQMWRIVPYDAVIYNEKNQQKHIFQYIPLISNPQPMKTNSSQIPQLGYDSIPHLKQTNKSTVQKSQQCQSAQKPQPFYKLGYEFQSGPHVNAYVQKVPQQKKVMSQPVKTQFSEITQPVRFPVKEKNNLRPIDKDNKGWFFIENVKYNLVMQVQGGIDERGMRIVLNKLYGNRNQLWKFV